jgi:hypothetical protein
MRGSCWLGEAEWGGGEEENEVVVVVYSSLACGDKGRKDERELGGWVKQNGGGRRSCGGCSSSSRFPLAPRKDNRTGIFPDQPRLVRVKGDIASAEQQTYEGRRLSSRSRQTPAEPATGQSMGFEALLTRRGKVRVYKCLHRLHRGIRSTITICFVRTHHISLACE